MLDMLCITAKSALGVRRDRRRFPVGANPTGDAPGLGARKKTSRSGKRSAAWCKVGYWSWPGKASNAVPMLTTGISMWQSTGATSLVPLHLSY